MIEANYSPKQYRDRVVHILDADPRTCEVLATHFRIQGFETNYSTSAEAFRAVLARGTPDVLVFNVKVGDFDGNELLREFHDELRGVVIVGIEDEVDLAAGIQAVKLGACDVLCKPIDCERLLSLATQEIRRNVVVPVAGRRSKPVEVRGFASLTSREREVLNQLTNGSSNKEAGRVLGISPRTVEVHRARIMGKLGARNAADLIRIVLTT